MRTYITPNGCRIERIAMPDDRIDKEVKAREGRPDHVETSSSIPCLEMPRKRSEDEDEADDGEDGEERVGRIRCVLEGHRVVKVYDC